MLPSDLRAPFFRKPWIRFTNGSGEVIPPYAFMRITGATFDDDEIVLQCAKPNTTFQRFGVVNGPFQVGPDATDEGLCTTLAQGGLVQVESASAAFGQTWGPTASQWYLTRYRYGFDIFGGAQTAGSIIVATAQQHPVNQVWGQTDGAITNGSTGTVEVYDGNDAAIASTTLTGVKNKTGRDIADNKKVWLGYFGGAWHILSDECA